MKSMIEKRKAMAGQGGFTLIELLVVIAILAVLGGATIIGIGALRGNAEEQVCETNEETLELALEAYDVAEGTPAPDLAALTGGADPYITDIEAGWAVTNGAISGRPAQC